MEPAQFYRQKLEDIGVIYQKLLRKKSAFGWIRTVTAVLVILAFYLLWNIGILWLAIVVVSLAVIFLRVLQSDLQNRDQIAYYDLLRSLYKDELRFLDGDYHLFPDGSEHIPSTHDYTNDLDIVGKDSLFQYINRTTSEMGSRQLSAYLQSPASPDDIARRQAATREFASRVTWIQELRARGKKKQVTFSALRRLQTWLDEPPVFLQFKPWKWLRYLLPTIILTVIGLYIYDKVPSSVFYGTLLIFAYLTDKIGKKVDPIHETLSQIAEEMGILSESLEFIEKTTFESPHLTALKERLTSGNRSASGEIHQLHQLLSRLDLRFNKVLSIPLNMLLFWNLQQMLELEKWKSHQQKNLTPWFEVLGHIEALYSLGMLHFNEPQWIIPEIVPEYFELEGIQVGHPLIPVSKRIANDVKISHKGNLMLVTGSNMAGKSTYLRSIGVNIALAMAGAPVCARHFKVSHVQLISSMRVADNLAESTSTFYSELKKLRRIIELINEGQKLFILLDEILRGTNSLDRHTGSVALIRQLIRNDSSAVVATHDLELASLKGEFPEQVFNYHFDVQVEGEELFFDYRLKPGVCTSMNASLLMKKIGIAL